MTTVIDMKKNENAKAGANGHAAAPPQQASFTFNFEKAKEKGYEVERIVHVDPDELVLIVDTAHPLYDPRVHLPPDKAFAERIVFVGGIKDPIQVHPEIVGGKECLVVVDGRRRVKATREANRGKAKDKRLLIPCRVVKGDTFGLYAAMIAANDRRPDTPLETAEKIERFVRVLGGTVPQAAKLFGGVSQETIRNMLGLSEKAVPELKKAVEKGLAASEAYKIAKLEPEKQKAAVKELTTEAGAPKAKGKALARAVEQARGKTKPSKASMRSFREVEAARERLKGSAPEAIHAAFKWLIGGKDSLLDPWLRKEEEA